MRWIWICISFLQRFIQSFMYELFRSVLKLLKIVVSMEVPHMAHGDRNSSSSLLCVHSLWCFFSKEEYLWLAAMATEAQSWLQLLTWQWEMRCGGICLLMVIFVFGSGSVLPTANYDFWWRNYRRNFSLFLLPYSPSRKFPLVCQKIKNNKREKKRFSFCLPASLLDPFSPVVSI